MTIRIKGFKSHWEDSWHLKVTRNGVPQEEKDLGYIEEDEVVSLILKRCKRLNGGFIDKEDVHESFYQDGHGRTEYSAGFILEGK